MFSEYASRFLAQSQTRPLPAQADPTASTRNLPDRQRGRRAGSSRFPSYLQRPAMQSPYGPSASQVSRFPFASRTSNAAAPLFFSATDEFREEDDGEEHEREVADLYALQRSRRDFGRSHLTESSELEEDADHSSPLGHSGDGDEEETDMPGFRGGRGIRSSWKGDKSVARGRPPGVETVQEKTERGQSVAKSEASAPSSKGKGKLVDVELASTVHDDAATLESDATRSDFEDDPDDHPPPIQQFRRAPMTTPSRPPLLGGVLPRETDEEIARLNPRPPSPDRESVPPGVTAEYSQPPRHDPFWATSFWISVAALFATFFLVWLDTSTPSSKNPLGDTIYTTLHRSFHLLGTDTVIAAVVAVLWLAALRTFARPLILLLTVAVPIILFSFFLYPLLSSYGGSWHGASIQDKAMRWLSFIPGVLTLMWIYIVYRGRHSYETAIQILEFGCRILEKSPALILTGFANLTAQIIWLWLWMLMFSRVFLGGHFSKPSSKGALFIIDSSTWWSGTFFVLIYLWVGAVLSGIQRATTAATVSQWYFHRLAVPSPSSRMVVQASLAHATTTLFGTICLSTLLALAVRLPLLLLPRRAVALVSLCAYGLVPTPIATLTNPLTLTYAAIHSLPLAPAARGLGGLAFVSKTSPTTTLTPTAFGARNGAGAALLPYRLAKLILHATRYILSICLGFRGWVVAARSLDVAAGLGAGVKGSLYAYVVGLVAAAIGWGVSGAMEGVLLGIVDALVVCWGSEVGANPGTEARYCREAGELFGERGGERRVGRY